MRQAWNELVSGFWAVQKAGTAEVRRYIPQRISEGVSQAQIDISSDLAARINDAAYAIANRRYDEAVALAEAAYFSDAMAAPLVYEHTLLIEPFEDMILDSQRSPALAEAMAKRFENWFLGSPSSPFAAAMFAKALHNAGYAWRGTEAANEVSREGWHKLALFEKAALAVFAISGDRHSDHWYWRECYFDISITDYRGARDHLLRFEKAVELQPLSANLWKNGAYHLLPRWHGTYEMLHTHCLAAHEATKAHAGAQLYHELFQMIHAYEGSDPGIVGSATILSEIASEHACSSDDEDLTIAAVCYLWSRDYDRFLGIMRRISTLHVHRWYSGDAPEHAVAFALEMQKRSARTRTRAA